MLVTLRSPYKTARGKDSVAGGLVLFPRGDRNVARAFVQPSNPNTTVQDTIRSYFTGASQAFNQLTNNERAAWLATANALGRTDLDGLAYEITDKGLYVGVNTSRQIDGQAITDVAPAATLTASVTGITAERDAGPPDVLRFVLTHAVAAGFFQIEISSALAGTQRHARENEIYLVSTVLPDCIVARGASPQTVEIAGANLKYDIQSADRIAVKVTSLSTGYVRGASLTSHVTVG